MEAYSTASLEAEHSPLVCVVPHRADSFYLDMIVSADRHMVDAY